jgi:SAM-dependent methyltransferase
MRVAKNAPGSVARFVLFRLGMIRFRGTRLKLRIMLAKLARRPRDVILRREFNLWAEHDAGPAMEVVHRPITERTIREMNLAADDRVLELACGDGWASREIAGRLGATSLVVGIDVSDGMVQQARAKSPHFRNLQFICGSAHRLPCKTAAFTKLLTVESFYYFEDQDAVLRELLRVVVPGGQVFVLICLYSDHPDSLSMPDEVKMPLHVRSAAEYRRMFESAGWTAVQSKEFVREREPGCKPDVHDRALLVIARKPTS